MKTFKQFLGESLDRSFPYKYHGEGEENTHEYSFSPGKKASKIRVSIIHNDKKRSATVTFHREDGQETATGEHPRTAAKVFGTVAKIVKEHGKKHRSSIDNINFSAAKSEPSRVSLYRRITKRLGGKETEPGKKETNFTVPNLSEMSEMSVPQGTTGKRKEWTPPMVGIRMASGKIEKHPPGKSSSSGGGNGD